MTAAFQDPARRHGAGVRTIVLARGGALRRSLVAALGELPGVTLLGAFSASELVVERARAHDLDVVFVDLEDFDPEAFGRSLRAVDSPPEWIAVTGQERSIGGAGAHALLCGAAGVIQRAVDDDTTKLVLRLRAALGTRIGTGEPVRRRSAPPVAAPPSRPSYGEGTPVPMTGRIVEPVRARRELLAIGCSTGGPPAVASLIEAMPASFRLPICVVQHMAAQHMTFFAENLARQLKRPVSLAQEHLLLEPGSVYVAAGDAHLALERDPAAIAGPLRLRLRSDPPEHNCRPAVDPFFRSVAEVCGAAAIGVVLTGMGSDGALGARALRAAGAPVLVQDADTSVVWGMPGATYQAGAACAVLPIDQLPTEIALWTMHTT